MTKTTLIATAMIAALLAGTGLATGQPTPPRTPNPSAEGSSAPSVGAPESGSPETGPIPGAEGSPSVSGPENPVSGTVAATGSPEAAESVGEGSGTSPESAGEAGGAAEAGAGSKDPGPVEAAEGDPLGSLGKLLEAIRSGHWRMAAALFLSLLMLGWNRARKEVGWLKERMSGDRAGAISVLAIAVVGGLITALASSSPLDYKLLLGSVWTAVDAAGIFLLVKRIWKPKDKADTASGEVG